MQANSDGDISSFKGKSLIGQRYGKLEVLSFAGRQAFPCGLKKSLWLCQCACGAQHTVLGCNLTIGYTKSCGCLSPEITAKRNFVHGKYSHTLYLTHQNMMARCYRKTSTSYRHYGGRGIKVQEVWHDFNVFFSDVIADWVPGLTLERKDVNSDYGPTLCRWASMTEQANNRRNSHFITCRGKTLTIAQWAKQSANGEGAIRARIKHGWNHEDAIFSPPR